MIPPLLLLAAGGLFGMAHERFRRKRLAAQISSELSQDELGVADQDDPVMVRGDLVQLKHSQIAARAALGVSAVGMLAYPPMILVSLPLIGYSAYSWLSTRYAFEQPLKKSPLRIVAILALLIALATGQWLLASVVLTTDLAARKWLANWTKGSRWIKEESGHDESEASDARWFAALIPSRLMQKVRYLLRVMLQGEPKWEWFPALLARVSMGLFFAISGWNKLFTAAHWKGLLAGMVATGLPFPKFLSLFLASVEFYGGSLLTIGFMSTFWAIALAFAMIVAIVTIEIPFVIPPGLGPLDWLDWLLYLPQVLYVLIFFWLIVKGPGPYSVDAVIARKLGLDKDLEEEPMKMIAEDKLGREEEPEETVVEDPVVEAVIIEEPKGGGASWTPA